MNGYKEIGFEHLEADLGDIIHLQQDTFTTENYCHYSVHLYFMDQRKWKLSFSSNEEVSGKCLGGKCGFNR